MLFSHHFLHFGVRNLNCVRNYIHFSRCSPIFRLGKLLNTKIARAPQYFFRREHDGQLTKLSKTNHKSKLRKQYIAIYEENKKSLNPDIYIEPICSKIVRIIIDKKENLI